MDGYSHYLVGALLRARVRSSTALETSVCADVIQLAALLDGATVCACVVLGDVPAGLKAAHNEREFSRRGSVKRTSTAGAGLQVSYRLYVSYY